ncbi:MAG TPA: hypothetical protein VF746_16150 [Longimicrobium sp.]
MVLPLSYFFAVAAKAGIAATAAACSAYDLRRARAGRPISTRIRKRVGLGLGAAAVAAYFAGAVTGPPRPPNVWTRFYNVWDQYHYFVGAKYFRELRYDGLYRCSAVALDELGTIRYAGEDGRAAAADLRAEVRAPGRLIRSLVDDNSLVPAAGALADPGACRARFTPARWAAFRADVRFFRLAAGPDVWWRMQRDHGFVGPPAWMIAGSTLARLRPAGTRWLQWMAALDLLLLGGMVAALWWAFGWRVAAVGAVFWGCQAFSTFFSTGGSFLRQDWLFLLVLSACLARKRRFAPAGAALMAAGLIRVFPLLLFVGVGAAAAGRLARRRRVPRSWLRFAAGAALAAAVLVPAGALVAGPRAWPEFVSAVRRLDRTPLANHLGLRVVLSHGVGSGPESGRMKYAVDASRPDPFARWKSLRLRRWERLRPAGYVLAGACLLWLAWVAGRSRSLWIVEGISQVCIVLLAQLTSYYYSFPVLAAPLTRARRGLEAPLLAFAAASQLVAAAFRYPDDRYAALSVLALLFTLGLVAAFRGEDSGREDERGEH